ncbi:uncharacterized protein LOC130285326 [Hyla sarda]|uniref:uncharacterized protein LOC130285326 n=1 Tax=Hyla sarda TaxID=327740 RepID=UPI0024C43F41|nr:uncharacterized protein LOC130285326 [Hyla sarda]
MKYPSGLFSVLLCSGLLVSLSTAVFTCSSGQVNETLLCPDVVDQVNLTAGTCNNTFQQYACSNTSELADLPEDFLVNLISCNDAKNGDPDYFTLLFSKLNSNNFTAVLSQLSSNFSSIGSVWSELLLDGIWFRIIENMKSSTVRSEWIPSGAQPFLIDVTPDMVQCLQNTNASCAAFQELVKNLDSVFPNMTSANQSDLYPALTSFLRSRQNLSDSTCSQNVSSSEWIQQNFGRFAQFADFKDLVALNAKFNALDALSLLTLPQIATFSVDLGPANGSAAVTSIMGKIQKASDAYDFLTYINAAAESKNISALYPTLAQALLNKTFEAIKSNVPAFTEANWTKLFQNELTLLLSQITPQVLSIVPQNISCELYQVIMKSLDPSFSQMVSGNQQNIYNSFIKPFLTKSGPTCSQNSNSSNFLTQNIGKFSQFADYRDFVAFDRNFSALDVLPVLTIRQRVDYSLTLNASSDPAAEASIVATLQNTNDLYEFLTYINTGIVSNNVSSVNVALSQNLLNKTFETIKANISMFTKSDWTQLFQDKLSALLPQISFQQLNFIPLNITCDSYQVILQSLDLNFPNMSSEIQQSIFKSLIKPYMTQKDSTCSQNVSSSEWIQQNFGRFTQFADFRDLVALNAKFNALDALSLLTLPQIATFSVDLGPANGSAAVTSIMGKIQKASDAYDFLTYINMAAVSKNISALYPTLAQALLNKTFEAIKSNVPAFTEANWTKLFQNELTLLLSQITPQVLSIVPQNISCELYQVIMKSLDPSFTQMVSGNQQNIYNSFIKPFLTKSGPTCDQNSNSSNFLTQNFGKFSQFADYRDFVAFDRNFSALDVLPVLTIRQRVDYSLTLNASSDPAAAASIVGTLQNTNDLYEFLTYLNTGIVSNNVSSVNLALSQNLLNKTFETIKANISMFTKSDWTQLFQDKLSALLPQISSQQLNLIPLNITCDSYQVILKSLDLNFPNMSSEIQQSIFKSLIKPYMTQKDSTCSQNVSSSTWIQQNFGRFTQFADFRDLVALNAKFNALDALSLLTLPQIATFSVDLGSANGSAAVTSIMGKIQKASDAYDFLTYINAAAVSKNISALYPTLAQALLNKTFEAIKSNIPAFTEANWTKLFQNELTLLLSQITPQVLSIVPQNISCELYQVIMKSLDLPFTQMVSGNQQNIYNSFIKAFLTKSGPTCAQNSNSSNFLAQNIGKFSQFADYRDFVAFDRNFSALDVLPVLTIRQRVDYSLTLNASSVPAVAVSIVGTLQNTNDLYEFLTYLNTGIVSNNVSSVNVALSQNLLNKTFEAIKANISIFTKSDWTQLFQDKLSALLPQISSQQISLIPLNITCDSYQVILKSLDLNFPNISSEIQQTIYKSLIKPYMTQKVGSACSQNVNSNVWIQQNFGRFVQFADFSDFAALNANFKPLDVLSLLTLPQIANYIVILGANNTATITSVLGTIQNANNMLTILDDINVISKNMSALQPPLAQALLNKTFQAIKPTVSTFTVNQWTQLFQNQLTLVLPQITPEVLSIVPQSINCSSYQAIIKGLDSSFNDMATGNQQSIYNSFIKPFLKKSGPTCSQNSSSSNFLTQNIGKFSQFADYSDLMAFNGNFSALDVLPILTLRQRVSFSLELNASSDPAAAASIVGTLQNTNDLYDFLDYLNIGVASKNISSVNAALSQALLNKTFDAIKANISMFNKSDWTQLFQDKLSALLPQISSQQFSLIPLNITCDSYQVILNSLNSNFPKMNSGTQQETYTSLIKPYLTQKGPSCAQNVGSGALIQQNFGKFSQFANYNDFVALNGNFSGGDVLSSLTIQQVIDYSVDRTINQAVAAGIIEMIKNATDIINFLTSQKTSALSNNVNSLSPYLSQGLLTKSFQMLKPNFNSFSSSDWTQLFQDKLSLVLPEISRDQLSLIPSNISCLSYQTIFNALQSSISQMANYNQENVYNYFIKPYLKQKGSTITCYNQSDPSSSAWLVNNVGPFMTYTSQEDLLFFANVSMLQTFANDPSSLQLAKQLNFPKETGIYFTSLLTSSPSFNLSSLPDTFLCYLTPSALTSLNAQTVLDVTKRINRQCYNTSAGQSAPALTADDVQVAISLVSKLDNFTSDTLVNLGQSAVGLSPGQINKINGSDLITSVTTLASVTGWSVGQTKFIMKKLLDSNFEVKNLTNLGSLVTGLPSKKMSELPPADVVNAVKDPQFASKLSEAPQTLQFAVVSQIVAANSTASNVVKNVPASLAAFIPKSLLLFKSEKASLQDVNGKSWSPDQAAMFFDDIVTTNDNYTQISSSVLQGFTCATTNKISNDKVKMLGKSMKTQKVSLTQDQLTCLSREITKSGYPTDLTSYSPEVFLFLNSTTYSSIGNCTDFFTNVGQANINVLPQGSSLRSNLLANALSCMSISGSKLTDSNIQVLGQLCCDLSPSYIANSSASILTLLSQCQSFTTEQQTSILTLLGKSLAASSTWTTDTLYSLGGISGFLTSDIVTSIPTVSFNSWLKSAIQASALTREQLVTIVLNRISTRSRRATGCTTGNITADNVNDNLLPVTYTAQQLDACLNNDILVNYLSVLSSKIFTNDQLLVLKNKLDALYPSGYPDTILSSLGAITKVCGDADVNKWSIGSVDTFSSLLAAGPSASLASSIITKYIRLGNPINAAALNVIGSQYICLLSSAQLSLITTTAISDAKALDVSACNQSVKDALYTTAKAAYQAQNSQVSIYYNLIKPYLGGAPAADLKSLAAMSPSMDVGTFVKLNPSAVLGLTVSDVKGLLGNNTVDLKTQLSNSVVSNWIAIQKQSDLDTLGLGIQGGIRDVATTTPTTTKTTSSSASVLAHGLLVLLAVFGTFLLTEDLMQKTIS